MDRIQAPAERPCGDRGGGWRYSVERPVIGSERFAGAVSDEHVIPVLAVEGGAHADDPVVLSEQPFGGVIAVWGGVVGAEDPAGFQASIQIGSVSVTAPVETTAHPLRLAGMRWRERADRASRALFAMSTKGGQSISHDIQKLPGESGDGAASPAGAAPLRCCPAVGTISAPVASPAAFRQTNTALPWWSA